MLLKILLTFEIKVVNPSDKYFVKLRNQNFVNLSKKRF